MEHMLSTSKFIEVPPPSTEATRQILRIVGLHGLIARNFNATGSNLQVLGHPTFGPPRALGHKATASGFSTFCIKAFLI